MKKTGGMRAVAALALLLMWPLTWAADPPAGTAPVISALQRLDASDIDRDWYFTMTLVEDGEQRVIRSDPSQGKYDKRSLALVDGRAPDEDRLQAFRKSERKRIDELEREEQPYSYLVNKQTLRLFESNEDVSRFSFFPRVKTLANSSGKIAGTVLLNNRSREIEKIEIYSTDTLSPAFSVTLESYRLSFLFTQEQGARLLQKMESRASGKAGFLKKFDKQVVVDFSDYRRAP